MKTVYLAMNTTDAHVVSGLLAQAGIEAVVLDENLGPYGHALGSVRVAVAPGDEAASRAVIAKWEALPRSDPPDARGGSPSRDAVVITIGLLALLAAVWYFGGR